MFAGRRKPASKPNISSVKCSKGENMSNSLPVDPAFSMKAAQDMELVRHKLQVDALRRELTPEQNPKARLREACQGFEAMFIQKMWEEMRNNVPKEGYLHSKDEQLYQSMFDHEFSKKMASAGGIGLADMLYDQLAQTLGDSSRTTSPGVNPRLPVLPASSSPSSQRFTEQEENIFRDVAAQNQTARRINPQYEEFAEENGPEAANAQAHLDAGPSAPESGILPEFSVPYLAPEEPGLDFEAISQELLREELQTGQPHRTQAQTHKPEAAEAGFRGGNKAHAGGGSFPSAALVGSRVSRKI
jgi:Rod binding domain-containing protein